MPIRKFIRSFVYSAIALYGTTQLIPGFQISPGISNLFVATLALTIFNLILRPILKLLLLPINLLTLGAFRWLVTIAILYLLTWFVPEVKLVNFSLSQIPFLGLFLPDFIVGKFIAALLSAVSLTGIRRLLVWLTKG